VGPNCALRRGINWLHLEKITMRKEYDGIEFRNFYDFNIIIQPTSIKEVWKIHSLINFRNPKLKRTTYSHMRV
jgi:hypothetical protein